MGGFVSVSGRQGLKKYILAGFDIRKKSNKVTIVKMSHCRISLRVFYSLVRVSFSISYSRLKCKLSGVSASEDVNVALGGL